LELGDHLFRIGDEIRREIAAVELHALDHFELGLERLGLLDGDDALVADPLHGAGDHLADRCIAVGRHRADLGDFGGRAHFAGPIALATVTPSLVSRGAPNDLSRSTLRPLGPSVTRTALARMSIPRSMRSRASAENFTSLAAMAFYSGSFILVWLVWVGRRRRGSARVFAGGTARFRRSCP